MKVYKFDTIFTFGKHKGKHINEIVSVDPAYITWCIINLDHFYITRELISTLSANHPNFILGDEGFKSLEIKEARMMEIAQNTADDRYIDSAEDYPNVFESEYYNDNLDMDQQSMEFWNEIG